MKKREEGCYNTHPNGSKNHLYSNLFKNSDSNKKPLTVRFRERQLKAIQEIADETGISKAEVIRRSVQKVLKKFIGVRA